MNKINQKQINDAAKAHAKDILGEQFKSNPDARKSVETDFKAGIKFLLKFQTQK